MDELGKIDGLLHGFLSRFFSIPARQALPVGMTFARMRMLWTLEFRESSTPAELAHRLGISRPTATSLLDRLAREGYIDRTPSKEDRRKLILTLRPKGRRITAQATKMRRAKLHKLLEKLDGKERREFTEALETLNRVTSKFEGDRR